MLLFTWCFTGTKSTEDPLPLWRFIGLLVPGTCWYYTLGVGGLQDFFIYGVQVGDVTRGFNERWLQRQQGLFGWRMSEKEFKNSSNEWNKALHRNQWRFHLKLGFCRPFPWPIPPQAEPVQSLFSKLCWCLRASGLWLAGPAPADMVTVHQCVPPSGAQFDPPAAPDWLIRHLLPRCTS